MKYIGIIAQDPNGVIGSKNTIPWNLPEDMKFFKETTTGHTVLMGRKTYESIGRPLPNRRNIVLTKNSDLVVKGVEVYTSLEDIKYSKNENIYVIGGAEIYKMFLEQKLLNELFITHVKKEYEGDTYSPFKDVGVYFNYTTLLGGSNDFYICHYRVE